MTTKKRENNKKSGIFRRPKHFFIQRVILWDFSDHKRRSFRTCIVVDASEKSYRVLSYLHILTHKFSNRFSQ